MIRIKDMGKEPRWLIIYSVLTKVIGAILIILSLLVITININMIAKDSKNQNSLPDFLGYKQIVIAGKSMLPVLDVGDVIITRPANKVKEQDVIVFRDKNNAVITHRIIKIETQEETIKYITQGDNNNSPDEPISENQIEGVVIFHLKGWGKIVEFLKSSAGLVLIIGIPVIYISITRYMSVQFYKKQMERKQDRIEYTNNRIGKRS